MLLVIFLFAENEIMKLRKITESKPPRTQDAWDLFGDDDTPRWKVVERQPPTTIPYRLELYRGFDMNMNEVERRNGKLVFSPVKGEQELIWFTHKLINNYNPVEYASSRGEFLLTYQLDCVRHIERKFYDDGSYYDAIPDEILNQTNPTSDSRLHMGIELPEGWVFSYKTEKFIGCGVELLVSPEMITKHDR